LNIIMRQPWRACLTKPQMPSFLGVNAVCNKTGTLREQ